MYPLKYLECIIVPRVEVINLFQDFLAENFIQNEYLNQQIREAAAVGGDIMNAENTQKSLRVSITEKLLNKTKHLLSKN
ncbi:hypothetical protein A9P82_01055 [Arachidicoccus ginsenosidimutans]|nr:hypothetical protein A9P82_01055 [Arachidicoccus sp. BS20]